MSTLELFPQLAAVIIIVTFLIKEMFAFLRERKNNNKSNFNFDNHLSAVHVKLDDLKNKAEELDRKLERITEILILIKDYLKDRFRE